MLTKRHLRRIIDTLETSTRIIESKRLIKEKQEALEAWQYDQIKELSPNRWQGPDFKYRYITNGDACQFAEWVLRNQKKLLKILCPEKQIRKKP